jgi:hypothetical protein
MGRVDRKTQADSAGKAKPKATTEFFRLVRIKPFDPKKGQLVKRFTVAGMNYREEQGWYPCRDEKIANALKSMHPEGDESRPLIFDVCTVEEARELERRESRRARSERRSSEDVGEEEGILTTRDVPTRSSKGKGRDVDRLEQLRRGEEEGPTSALAKMDQARRAAPENQPEGQQQKPPPMLDPDPEGADLPSEDGRNTAVGRVSADEAAGGGEAAGRARRRAAPAGPATPAAPAQEQKAPEAEKVPEQK